MAKEAKDDKAKAPKVAKEAKGEKGAKGDKEAKGKSEKEPKAPKSTVVPRLKTRYEKEILPALAEKFGRANRLSLPRVQKIVVSMGVGSAIADKKHMEDAVSAMAEITGQKPLVCKARKSVANFRLRAGLAIGCKVTLRGARMYEFLDRLISLALPRVRDFRGLNPDAFDGHGNYSLGLTEQLVFPELNPDKYLRPQGMNIAICCSAGSDEESREMLRMFGVPFRTAEEAAA
jgi:large subunit ribosomal protein L5